MLKATRLRLFLDGYREVIQGSDLDIVNCTTAMHDVYEEGKQAARDDMQQRMQGPFNQHPTFVAEPTVPNPSTGVGEQDE